MEKATQQTKKIEKNDLETEKDTKARTALAMKIKAGIKAGGWALSD